MATKTWLRLLQLKLVLSNSSIFISVSVIPLSLWLPLQQLHPPVQEGGGRHLREQAGVQGHPYHPAE